MMSLAVHKCMRNISPEMPPPLLLLLPLLVPILWLLPLTGAAPSATTEQLDTGVVSFSTLSSFLLLNTTLSASFPSVLPLLLDADPLHT